MEWQTHSFLGFSPNRAYCKNTNATSPAEGHDRGPTGRQARPWHVPPAGCGLGGPSRTTTREPKRDAHHTSTERQGPQAQEGRREEGAAQEEETPHHSPAAAKRRRAADGEAGPWPEPGPGGGLHRWRVGHGVRWWLELSRCRRGVPPAGLPLRSAGQQEGRIWGRNLPSYSPRRCPVLRAGEDTAGVWPRRHRHAQLLPRGGRRCGVQPGGGGRLVTEQLKDKEHIPFLPNHLNQRQCWGGWALP